MGYKTWSTSTKGITVLKKSITFEDLDGNSVTEDFYFSLSIPELTKMQVSTEGGLGEKFEEIVKKGDGGAIMELFEDILEKSVGRRSEDGRRFLKNDQIRDDFMMSDAYNVLFVELCTDAQKGAEFMNGIMPTMDKIEKFAEGLKANAEAAENKGTETEKPLWMREDREPTHEEVLKMDKAELLLAMKYRTEKAQRTQSES